MPKVRVIPEKYQVWIDTKKRYHLSDTQIQMAGELGLNPRKFGKLANEKQEPWKKPLPEFIEDLYFKRFKKKQPDVVKSIEQLVQDQRERKAERKEREMNLEDSEQTQSNVDVALPK
jgi:hypothetical protein